MMQSLLIGSMALTQYLPHVRTPKDVDAFSPDPIPGAETFWHPILEDWIPPGTDRVATLDELYTIKVSHAYWSLKNNSWLKHMWDICQMKAAGAVVHQPFHDDLYRIWTLTHGRKKVDLNKDKAEFFSPTVRRAYEHDSIHWTVCYYDKPLYLQVLKDGSDVAVDPGKLHGLSVDDLIRLYREETYVTALERIVIPAGYVTSAKAAYSAALKQMITSYTKGWSAQFLVEHYDVLRVPDVDYVQLHLSRKYRLLKLEV
jgi:hypothetical protein